MNSHDHPLYSVWRSMRSRCNNQFNKAFHRYGGRGITVCPEWDDFYVFCDDMGERPDGATLERKNNQDGYCKGNCVWATRREQARNTRRNRWLTVHGERMLLDDAAERFAVSRSLIAARIDRMGWSEELAATTPANVTKRRFLRVGSRTIGLSEAAAEFGISLKTIHHRIVVLGWSDERAATEPARVR